jgi:dephospho-CoA kinase
MARYAVGLTGGIASGKSAVSDRLAALGAAVVDADAVARDVVAPGSDGLAELVAVFGDGILDADRALDRRRMREHVFNDPAARARLEAIVHPRVRARLRADAELADAPYAIVAIPLLAEGGGRAAYPWLDRILVVDVPVDVQLRRLVSRDCIDPELARRMIDAQATRERRLAIADDVLVNTGDPEALDAPIAALHRRYAHLAALCVRGDLPEPAKPLAPTGSQPAGP